MSSTSPLEKGVLLASGVGALASFVNLALSIIGAVALSDLARGDLARGGWLLVSVLVARGLVAVALDEWSARRGATTRAQLRHQLPSLLSRPRPTNDAQSDLAWAIEQSALADDLTRLRASAGASIVAIIVIFFSAGWLASVITVGLLGLAVPLYRRAGRRSEALATEYQRRRVQLEERQLEILRHAPELRGLGAVDYGAREIAAYSDREHDAALRAIRVALESSLVTEFLSGVSIGLVAMVVGFGLLEGRLSLTRALIAVFATSDLFGAIRRYGVEFHRRDDAARAEVVLRRGTLPEIDRADLFELREVVTAASTRPVNLRVERGARVVVTGSSGAGKTTLLETMLGWRAVVSGEVLRPASRVGVIQPTMTLLSGTLRENLSLGASVSDRTLRERLDELGLRGERFDDLSSELLADGRGLSDGERVRVLLARAFVAEVATLFIDDVAGLFDEATRGLVRAALTVRPELAIVEASVDRPLIVSPSARVELTP